MAVNCVARTVLVAALATVSFGVCASEVQAYWMMYTGPDGGEWGVDASWTANEDANTHRVPGSAGVTDYAGQVNGAKTVYVSSDYRANLVTSLRFTGGAIGEIQAGGALASGSEVDATSQVNVRAGGTIATSAGAAAGVWGQINAYTGSTVKVSNLNGTSHLYGGDIFIFNLNGGSIVQDGATVEVNRYVMLNGTASYQLNSGRVFNGNGAESVRVGMAAGATPTFTMTGGILDYSGLVLGESNSSGTFTLSGGDVNLANSVTLGTAGGTSTPTLELRGAGATFDVGTGSGTKFTSYANGTLSFVVGPAGVSSIHIVSTGTASLAGTLDMGLIDGFTPALDDTFTLMSAGTINNTGLALASGDTNDWSFTIQGTPGAGQTLVATYIAVPEPATLSLGVVTAAGLLLRRQGSGRTQAKSVFFR